jgi:hypothetical protein
MRRGACLPLDRSSTPPHLYQLMRVGLLLNNQQGDQGMLDLQEIRDMLLFTRVSYVLPYHMGQITIKTTNPKCRLHWCLIEFIDCCCQSVNFSKESITSTGPNPFPFLLLLCLPKVNSFRNIIFYLSTVFTFRHIFNHKNCRCFL